MQFMPKSASLNKCRDMELTNTVAVHSNMSGRNVWINFETPKQYICLLNICFGNLENPCQAEGLSFPGLLISRLVFLDFCPPPSEKGLLFPRLLFHGLLFPSGLLFPRLFSLADFFPRTFVPRTFVPWTFVPQTFFPWQTFSPGLLSPGHLFP